MKESRDMLAGEELLAFKARFQALEEEVKSKERRIAALERFVKSIHIAVNSGVESLMLHLKHAQEQPETIREQAQEGK